MTDPNINQIKNLPYVYICDFWGNVHMIGEIVFLRIRIVYRHVNPPWLWLSHSSAPRQLLPLAGI